MIFSNILWIVKDSELGFVEQITLLKMSDHISRYIEQIKCSLLDPLEI